MKETQEFDIVVVGGGIVGLSTAWQLVRKYPAMSVALIEKEKEVAKHQTGHNSGVIHAGVYYQPGSLKARFCREGAEATKNFCHKFQIRYEECGKLLVATNEAELERMQDLYHRCHENQITVKELDQEQLKKQEPNIEGLGALFVPSTGIVSYREICIKLAELFEKSGGLIMLNTRVKGMKEDSEGVTVKTSQGRVRGKYLVSCSGLMADRVTRMLGIKTDFQIIPFRGEYYQLAQQHDRIVHHLIYPIPDPDLPFLGVHLTRMIDGSVTVGPNAVQGWKREGYGWINFSLKDTLQMICFPGFWRLLFKYWKTGFKETRNSWWKAGYLAEVRKYCPSLKMSDLRSYPAGIRAQAVKKDGTLIHDFLFAESDRTLHVCNAPSPAATSAFPIGRHIIDKLDSKMTNLL